ncbi:hypothetical protein HDU97_003194 [Phlyctochytrium planicorne]|nr:hypothetical protein HDU97_003194 [Phlyctochytrium planicorne]
MLLTRLLMAAASCAAAVHALALPLDPIPVPSNSSSTIADPSIPVPSSSPFSVTANRNGFVVDGIPRILRGGTIQWFRTAPEHWEDRILKFKAMGFNTIDAYVGWRNHEVAEGVFDWKTYDLVAFLELCKKHSMWVYLRPGPYITNEMDGGGVPQWVFTKTTKRVRDADNNDGLINLRTNDKDYIDCVRRYFTALLGQVKPYLHHVAGGPIILMAIENEFTWFEQFFEVDKLSIMPDGLPERPDNQTIETKAYMTILRQILIDGGVELPIATGPGDGKVSGLGNAEGVIPMPSVYRNLPGEYTIPYTAVSLLNDMHNEKNHDGVYTNLPSGITETLRDPYVLRASIFSGLDAVFQFNVVGFSQEGYQNAMLANSGDVVNLQQAISLFQKFTNFTVNRLPTAFLRPQVGMFGNVLDYYASVSPSGLLREKFHQVRRFNIFLNDFETMVAPLGHAKRSIYRAWPTWLTGKKNYVDMDTSVLVLDKRIGSNDPDVKGERVNYWLEVAPKSALVLLYNDAKDGRAIKVAKNSVKAFNVTFPRFSDFVVPVETATSNEEKQNHQRYGMILPFNVALPISTNLNILYSTSEILTARAWGSKERGLLVVYGSRGVSGEIAFTPTAKVGYESIKHTVVSSPEAAGFKQQTEAEELTFTFIHSAEPIHITLSVPSANGQTLETDVIIMDTYLAGKCWFPSSPSNSGAKLNLSKAMVCGPDFIDESKPFDPENLSVELAGSTSIFTFRPPQNGAGTPAGFFKYDADASATPQFSSPNFASGGRVVSLPSFSSIPILATSDYKETLPATVPSAEEGWIKIGDKPVPLETYGFSTGMSFYRAEVMMTESDMALHKSGNKSLSISIESASDVVGIYLNGHFVATLNPIGTEVNSLSNDPFYHFDIPSEFLQPDVTKPQILTFRVEVWGHGSFMWFRGALARVPNPLPFGPRFIPIPFARGALPSLGYDTLKGLRGNATFFEKPLTNWYLKKGTTLESLASPTPSQGGSLLSNPTNAIAAVKGSFDITPFLPSTTNSSTKQFPADITNWRNTSLPLSLQPGEIIWLTMEIDPSSLPDPSTWTTSLQLRLHGQNAMATIYWNGRLIGRWLSDEKWIAKGNWAKPLRGPWSVGDEDEIELGIATAAVRDGGKGRITIRLVDCGGVKERGVLESLQFVFSKNEERFPRADGDGNILFNSLRKVALKV